MPIYEFRCLNCGSQFEKIVPLNTESASCEKCQGTNVEKLLSTFAVQTNQYSPCGASANACQSCCGTAQPGLCSSN
jgi:putative FmdB family regulatory protein